MPVVTDVPTKEWEEFYKSHTEIPILQSPSMYQVWARTRGMTPEVLFFVESGAVRGSLLSVRQVWGRRAVARFFSRYLIQAGPQGDLGALRPLLQEHRRLARRNSIFSEVRPILPNHSLNEIALSCGFRPEPYLNFVLELSKGESELWNSMSRSRRRNIHSAEQLGLSIRDVTCDKDVLQFHGLVHQTYSRAGLPSPDPTLFLAANEVFGPRGEWIAVCVLEDSTPVAARAVLVSDGVLHDWYAGSSDRGRDLHADEWLVWQLLRRGIARSARMFEFGGSGPVGGGYGPGEFKRRFGGREERPGRMVAVYRPLEYVVGRVGWKTMSQIRGR